MADVDTDMETIVDPQQGGPCAALLRTYHFREEASEKAAEWGNSLWRLIRSKVNLDVPDIVRDRGAFEYISERMTNYLVARLITRGIDIDKRTVDIPSEQRDEKFAEAVDEILNVPEVFRDQIVWYLAKACERIRKKGAQLTSYQKKTIENFATENRHRCYLCGQELIYSKGSYPDEDNPFNQENIKWRAFEIDHMFPQSRGGGRSCRNLAACCNSCNKYKENLLSFADLAVENILTSSTRDEKVKAAFDGRNKFAILWKQRGSCAQCETKFYDIDDEKIYLRKKMETDSFHFLNVEFICHPCLTASSQSGVLIRE